MENGRRSVFAGLNPGSALRKIAWRFSLTPFLKAFKRSASLSDEFIETHKLPRPEAKIFECTDRWVREGKIDKARFWLIEGYKHTHPQSERRRIEYACRLAELDPHPFKALEPDLSRLMLTMAYSTLRMQKGFTKRLVEKARGDVNKYGEVREELDDWADTTISEMLLKSGLVKKIYSEEIDGFKEGNPAARYVVSYDPLDGSSNIKSKNPFGTIFAIWEGDLPQCGRHLVAAGMALFGPVFTFTYSTRNGVNQLVNEYEGRQYTQFTLLHERLKIPEEKGVYGIGGQEKDWDPHFHHYVDTRIKPHLKVRYVGAAVSDVQHVLHEGGIFAYPSLKQKPDGKLRLNYECNPLAFLIEQAGGASWDGRTGSILDIYNPDIDATTPFFVGSHAQIEALKQFMQDHPQSL